MKNIEFLLFISLPFFYISCSPEAPDVVDVTEDKSSKIFLSEEDVKFGFNTDTLKFVGTNTSKIFLEETVVVESFFFDADAGKEERPYRILDMNEFSEEDRQRIESQINLINEGYYDFPVTNW